MVQAKKNVSFFNGVFKLLTSTVLTKNNNSIRLSYFTFVINIWIIKRNTWSYTKYMIKVVNFYKSLFPERRRVIKMIAFFFAKRSNMEHNPLIKKKWCATHMGVCVFCSHALDINLIYLCPHNQSSFILSESVYCIKVKWYLSHHMCILSFHSFVQSTDRSICCLNYESADSDWQ